LVKHFKASLNHESHKHKLKHFFYSGGWKKFEPVWNVLIKTKNLNNTLPILESVLSKISKTTLSTELGNSRKDELEPTKVFSKVLADLTL